MSLFSVFIWTIGFSLSTAFSITLMGQKSLISGNLFSIEKVVSILLDFRFIASMVLAVCARVCFIFLNNAVLKIPSLKEGATTIAAFVSAFSFVFIVLTNMLFLKERINLRQGVGAFVIIVGIIILTAEPKAFK